MPANLESLLERFVSACLDVFGEERVEGLVLHGSAAKGGGIPGYSDVDFMVFLTADSFDRDLALPAEKVFAIQERIGPLPWRDAGFAYPQAYFYDARRLPSWWTGPVPGAHRVLWGRLPPQAMPTDEGLRASSARFLEEELPKHIASDLRTFADADDSTLPRRVRLLGTSVAPAVFALLTLDAEDPLKLWALPKFEALERLEQRYPGSDGPVLARRFFDDVRSLYEGEFDRDLGRRTFRTGIEFLRWAEEQARSPAPAETSLEG